MDVNMLELRRRIISNQLNVNIKSDDIIFLNTAQNEVIQHLIVHLPYKADGYTQAKVQISGDSIVHNSSNNTGTLTRNGLTFTFPDQNSVKINGISSNEVYPLLYTLNGATVLNNNSWQSLSNCLPLDNLILTLYGTVRGTGSTYGGSESNPKIITIGGYRSSDESQYVLKAAGNTNRLKALSGVSLELPPSTTFIDFVIKWIIVDSTNVKNYTVNFKKIYGGDVDFITGKIISKYAANGTILSNPIITTITPIVLSTKKGITSIWSDSGTYTAPASVTVTYLYH